MPKYARKGISGALFLYQETPQGYHYGDAAAAAAMIQEIKAQELSGALRITISTHIKGRSFYI